MDDAAPVRVRERVGDLPRDARRVADRQAPLLLQQLAQRRPVDAPHDDVEHFVLETAHLVDGHDVGVLQVGDGARLAHEALGERGGGCETEVEDFDRHVAVERGVVNAKNGGEAAFAQEGTDGKFVAQGLLQATTERGEIQRAHGGRET